MTDGREDAQCAACTARIPSEWDYCPECEPRPVGGNLKRPEDPADEGFADEAVRRDFEEWKRRQVDRIRRETRRTTGL